MNHSKISRRKFVGAAALGAGSLALTAPSRLMAGDPPLLAPVLKSVWTQSKQYLMEFAEAMPEEKYGFKPTDEVFSFAEQLLHLAGTNYWCFSVMKGEKAPKTPEEMKVEGKSEVMGLLKESFAYGEGIISGLTEETAAAEIQMGRRKMAQWKVILFCADHISHHRGQIVTYLRLNGIKPPDYRSGFFG
jgi:uncharacterized damage-inducible protein DinB